MPEPSKTNKPTTDKPDADKPKASRSPGDRRSRLFCLFCGTRLTTKWRYAARLLIAIPLFSALLVGLAYLLVPKYVLLPAIRGRFGLDIAAQRVVLFNRNLDLVLEGVTVRVPGIEGTAGKIVEIARLEADYDWTAMLSGGMPIERVVLYSPVVRISQDVETGVLNLADLGTGGGGKRGFGRLPAISIVGNPEASDARRFSSDAAIEIGEHRGDSYVRLWRIGIDGQLRPSDAVGDYDVDLLGVTDVASDSIVRISGQVGKSGTTLTVDDVNLAIDPSKVPTRLREAFDRFDLVGRIPEMTFERLAGQTPVIRLLLEDVAMTLPFDPDSDDGARLLRTTGELSSVGGRISGKVNGIAEDVPYAIEFETGDVGEGDLRDVPFELTATVENYEMPPDPPVVPFLPRDVQVRLDQFSNPTGIVDAQISLNRVLAGGEILYAGQLNLREGRAAYYSFPYTFENLTGTVEFDSEGIRLREIRGSAPTGATVVARGEIAPPNELARVDLEIVVNDVPIDETLISALDDDRRQVLDQLISQPGYEDLLERGYLKRPGAEGPGIEFEPGGEVSVAISLKRRFGEMSIWDRRFGVSMDGVRLLPELFRMPVVARGALVQLTEHTMQIIQGGFESPTGAVGSVRGTGILKTDSGESVFRPDIRIEVEDVPGGDWMRAALSAVGEGTTSEIMESLGLDGTTSGSVRLVTRDDGGLGFEIDASLENAMSRTTSLEDVAPLTLDPSEGGVRINESGMTYDFRAVASAPGATDSAFRARGSVDWEPIDDGQGGELPVRFGLRVESDAADAWLPYEQMSAVFSPDAAAWILSMRDEFQPAGTVSVVHEMETDALRTTISEASTLSFTHAGGRAELRPDRGLIVVESVGAEPDFVVTFDDFSSSVFFDSAPAGRLGLVGSLPMSRAREGTLRVAWRDGRFESTLVRALVRQHLPEQIGLWTEEFDPIGGFEIDASLSRSGEEIEARGEARFGELSIIRQGNRIDLGEVGGRASFVPASIALEDIALSTEAFDAQGEGVIRYDDPARATFDGRVSVVAPRLDPTLVALLPLASRELVESLELEIDGPLDVPGVRMSVVGDERGPAISLDGDILFTDAAATSGVRFTEGDGNASLSLEIEPGGVPDFTAIVDMGEVLVSGVRVTDGTMLVTGDANEPGVVRVRRVDGSSHGGRIAGEAVLFASEDGGEVDSYTVDVRLGDVSVVGALNDLARAKDANAELRTETGARLSGEISLGGKSGIPETAIGRGELTMFGGAIIEMPFTLGLLEAGHFRLPTGATIDSAHTDFYLAGETVTFESLSLLSGAVDLYGYGTMTWPGQELDLRFITRSSSRIPLLSALAEGVRDELVTTTIRGTVGEQEVGTEPFKVTRRLLREILGVEPSAQQARIEEIAEALEQRTRRRRVTSENDLVWPEPFRATDASVLPSLGTSSGTSEDMNE